MKANRFVRPFVFPYPCKCESFCFALTWLTYQVERWNADDCSIAIRPTKSHYSRKKQYLFSAVNTTADHPCVAHRPPVCRRKLFSKQTPTQIENHPFGAIKGRACESQTDDLWQLFQAFSLGRKSSRRKSRGRKRPSTRFTADGNADRTRVFGRLAL